MDAWRGMSAAALGREIEAGRADPLDLAEAYLSAAEADPESHRVYARMTADRARAEAQAAAGRARRGLRRSPLDGVPLSWKDVFDTAGIATEAGTALLAGRVPDRDADVLVTATANGLVCLGKTHLSEIAFSGLGYNPVTATPPNANDAGAVPGGSSSGAAASVVRGLAPAGIGSDTGGSVRLPAAWNDLVGFKPAHGALPLTGVVPLCARFDTVGPLTRSVEDAALLYAALGGTRTDLAGARLDGAILLVPETVVTEDVEDRPAATFEAALGRLARAGARIERRAFAPLARAYGLAGPLYTAEAWAFWRPLVEAAPDRMYHQIRARVSLGADVAASDWIAAWAELDTIRAEFRAWSAGADAVVCATAAILPPKLADLVADDAYYVERNLATLRNTRLGNLMGLCAISLPAGEPSCGIMLHGPAGGEGRLLRLAAAAERALA